MRPQALPAGCGHKRGWTVNDVTGMLRGMRRATIGLWLSGFLAGLGLGFFLAWWLYGS